MIPWGIHAALASVDLMMCRAFRFSAEPDAAPAGRLSSFSLEHAKVDNDVRIRVPEFLLQPGHRQTMTRFEICDHGFLFESQRDVI